MRSSNNPASSGPATRIRRLALLSVLAPLGLLVLESAGESFFAAPRIGGPLAGPPLLFTKPARPLRISRSTRIEPGQYVIPASTGEAAIEIIADQVTLDLSGVSLSSGVETPWTMEGAGIRSSGHSHVTVLGGEIRGYRYGMLLEKGEQMAVLGTNASHNRAQKLLSTESKYDEGDWLDIFHLAAWESYGAGVYLKDVRGARLQGVSTHGGQNGILLANTTSATIVGCDASNNSGWGIGLFHSSGNDVLSNRADWNVRCEGKNYSAGCDSAGLLLMEGSHSNRVFSNSFTHSGDGYFVSKPPSGASSDFNIVAFNDGSFSPHNAFESTFTRDDQFYRNTADSSDYGFWLGFSSETTVIDNHVEGSRHDGIAIEHGSGNVIARNQILRSGSAGVRLFRRQPVPDPSRDYAILENHFEKNPVAIQLNQTYDVTITGNLFEGNGLGVKAEKGTSRVVLRDNRFSPADSKQVESDEPAAIEP